MEDIIKRLAEYEINPIVIDPWADKEDAMHEYGVKLSSMEDAKDLDCIIMAVGHEEFKNLKLSDIDKMFKDMPSENKVLIDVKGLYNIKEIGEKGYKYWRL